MPRRKRAKRGSGSVYFDAANGVWMAAVSVRGKDGRRARRKARAIDEDDAHRQLDRLRRATRAGVDPATGTVDRYFREWLEDVRSTVRPSTFTSYEGHFRLHISPLLGGISLVRLRPADVRRLKTQLGDKSPATVARVLTTLRMALNQAVREGLLPDNPAAMVPLPRVERHPVEAMTEAQAEAIIEATRGTSIEHLVVLLLGSGLRAGEALGLDWRDVGDGFVVVRRSKTQPRAVPISDDAMAALAAQKAATPRWGDAVPVFLGERKSQRMRVDTALQVFQRALDDAGLPRMRLHDLRHGVATLLVARGVSLKMVAEQLGHRSITMTNRYAHVLPESQRQAVALLNRPKRTG